MAWPVLSNSDKKGNFSVKSNHGQHTILRRSKLMHQVWYLRKNRLLSLQSYRIYKNGKQKSAASCWPVLCVNWFELMHACVWYNYESRPHSRNWWVIMGNVSVKVSNAFPFMSLQKTTENAIYYIRKFVTRSHQPILIN